MNAAKKIRQYWESGQDAAQVEVLLALAFSLQTGLPLCLTPLHDLATPYFETAMKLMEEWHLDHHIASRSKLMEMIYARNQLQLRQALPRATVAPEL